MPKLISYIIIAICFASLAVAEQKNNISNFRISNSSVKLRFVIDMQSRVGYNIYQLSSPERVVIDINDSVFSDILPKLVNNKLVKSLRHYKSDSKARIVLDLSQTPKDVDNFVLAPSTANENYRIVVDLYHQKTIDKSEKNQVDNLQTQDVSKSKEVEKTQDDPLGKSKNLEDTNPDKSKNLEDNKSKIEKSSDANTPDRSSLNEEKKTSDKISDVVEPRQKIIVRLKPDLFSEKQNEVQVKRNEVQVKKDKQESSNVQVGEKLKENIDSLENTIQDLNDIIIVKLKEKAKKAVKSSDSNFDRSDNTDNTKSKTANESKLVEIFPAPVAILKIPTPVFRPRYKPMIVIDAGHGGRDPGAIGVKKSYEKNITLAYAKELQRQLKKSNKYDVLMVRDKDVYLKLQERVNKARSVAGDLFISLHVNASKKSSVRGFSIYTLSETASDKEAAALARKENKAGLINGVNLNDETDELTGLLINMTQRQTKNISAIFAETIVNIMGKDIKLLERPHRFAGFRVLTGADIPSVLIELGYLTNKKEEKMLNLSWYKNKLVEAIVKSIDIHFNK